MPVVPSFTERVLVPRLSKTFGVVTKLFVDIVAAGAFRAAAVALRLGVFEALNRDPLTAAEVATAIKADGRATAVLLDALEAFGYLKETERRYANTDISRALLRDSPNSLSQLIQNFETLVFEFWDLHLGEAVRKGRSSVTFYDWLNRSPERWRLFNSFEVTLARLFGDAIARKAQVPPAARRLLDVGGGHGMHSVIFCRRYPALSATVLDKPEPLETAHHVIASEGMTGRVSTQPGDFWIDGFGEGYDVALVFNVLHGYLPDENIALLRKVASALNPCGLVVIWENIRGEEGGPLFRAVNRMFGLNYLVTLGSQVYSFDEISRWLISSGFRNPRRPRPVSLGLVTATKAG